MKKHLLSILMFVISFMTINAQKNGENKLLNTCDVTSNFTYSKSDCDTLVFTATPNSNSDTTILGYFWTFGDGTTSTVQNPTHSFIANSNYTVSLTVIGFNNNSGDCCNNSKSRVISINCIPPCGVTINSIQEVNGLGQDNVAFYATTQVSSSWNITNSIFTLTYENGNVLNYNGNINPSNGYPQILIPVNCANPVIKVTVTIFASASGITCSDTRTRSWKFGVCGTGNSFKISPNPVKHTLTINVKETIFKNNSKIEMLFFNLRGEEIKRIQINSQKINLPNIKELTTGIYILKLVVNNQTIDRQKLVVID